MKVYIKILFLAGVFLLFAGIAMTQIMGSDSPFAIATVILALVVIIIGLISFLYTSKGFWSLRSTETATNAFVSTVAVILIVLLINFLAIKYAFKVDLTENKLFTLSPASQELVANLDSELKVYVFDSPVNEVDRELLDNYQRYSDLFSYQFVDPQVDLSLAQKFEVRGLGGVYLEYQDRQQLAQIISPQSRLSEVKLTTAIAKIQKEIQAKIYILQGHGEALLQQGGQLSFVQAVEGLTNQGYEVKPLNLETNPLVPPEVDVLLVSSSQRNLAPVEVQKIQQYVDRGGNLLVMYNAGNNNSLTDILTAWGVEINDSLAIDSSGTGDLFGFGPSITIVTNYGNHPITQDFNNGMTIFPWARPILTSELKEIEATPLIITSNLSWGETNLEQENVEFNQNEDIAGPFNLGVAFVRKNPVASEQTPENPNKVSENQVNSPPVQPRSDANLGDNELPLPPTMKTPDEQPKPKANNQSQKMKTQQKMVVIGNSNFATDGWFQQQLNSDLFLNAIAWLADEEEQNLSIRPKQATNRRLNISSTQATLITWLALLIIPCLSLVAAITTWWQRSR